MTNRIALETAIPVHAAFVVYCVTGESALPCEAYALASCGKYLSGDCDDISAHVASGGIFITYEGYLTRYAAQAAADCANASNADGVARYGWSAGTHYEVRALPAGCAFHFRDETESLAIVAPCASVSPKSELAVMTAERGALLSLSCAIDVFGMRNGYPAGIRAARKRLEMAFKAKQDATVHRNLLLAKAEFKRAVANIASAS